MALLQIVYYPDPILKQKAQDVEIINDDLRQFLDDMLETMYANHGIGLAAPQVGRSVRATVIDVRDEESEEGQVLKLINPIIVEREGTVDFEEGCLSIPDIRESVRRSEVVVVEALDENGDEVVIEADGLLAICLQHEIDHLDGVLFIDRLSTLRRELLRQKLKGVAETKATKPSS